MTVKAVLFDMGNTLIKYNNEPEEIFQKVLDSMGFSRSTEEIKEALSKTEQEFESLHLQHLFGKIPSTEYWNKWNCAALKHLNILQNETLGRQVQDRWFDHLDWEAYPHAKETLLRLKQMGLKTGLVTTAYEKEIDLILRGANLQKKNFDVIVGADTIREVKPHPNVFRHALRRLEVRPEEALFVGDSIDADYKAAESVRIKAVLVLRTTNNIDKASNFRTIRSLEEIFQFIG